MSDYVLQCTNLVRTFADGKLKVEVLKGVNLQVVKGETLAILGTSGSGKSTLLHLLGGLDKPTAGSVTILGQEINKLSPAKQGNLRNQYLGFVYQFHHLLPEFDALENVCIPLLIRKISPKEAKAKAREILLKVGLKERLYHRVGELSGGERQRVAIARALVTEPKCVLADEPTGNLDHSTADKIIDLMLNLNKELEISFIVVTHDIDLANKLQKQYVIEDGKLVD